MYLLWGRIDGSTATPALTGSPNISAAIALSFMLVHCGNLPRKRTWSCVVGDAGTIPSNFTCGRTVMPRRTNCPPVEGGGHGFSGVLYCQRTSILLGQ